MSLLLDETVIFSICFLFSFQFCFTSVMHIISAADFLLFCSNSARKCLIMSAECSPQKSLLMLEILPAEFIQACQKHRAISRQEKMAFSTPRRFVLELPSPSRRVCADGRSRDYYVTTKISRINRLPNFLTNGAPLAGFARRLRY